VIARIGGLLACVPIALTNVGASPAAATPAQQPPPPQRILIVGDSTAETLFPFLRDAAAPRGISVAAAARIGCGVIDGAPRLDDGRPYIDYFGDTSQCASISESLQRQALASQNPDMIVWISGWESWPNRLLDGQIVRFGTIAGNEAIAGRIDAAVGRLTAGGARLVFLPVAPNAYPSVRGLANIQGDSRLAELANLLRGYVRQHTDKVSLIDLPTILQCPTAEKCPAEVAPGIRPRNLDGFHFDGDGAVWLADQLIGMLVGTTPPPAAPAPPPCVAASLGNGLAAAGGGKCAQ
jgi:hypothetical protein